ncbi:glycosyltransferase family 25 protein [Enterobacter ludwigii]
MKVFIINLKSETKKRNNIEAQCKANGFDYEIIDAVNGRDLQNETTHLMAYKHPHSRLTKGVMGCTLSHLYIYSRMVAENIPYALVLEDDITITEPAKSVIESVEMSIRPRSREIYLLNTPEALTPIIKKTLPDSVTFYRMARASQSPAYILSIETAKTLLGFNYPIKYEVDRWVAFRDYCNIKIWCLPEGVIDSYDQDKLESTLEAERSKVEHERLRFLSKLRKKEKGYQKKRLLNLILKKISHQVI